MPISGARYRVKTTSSGKRVRLAFKGNKVVEAKNIDSGDVHTPAEFAADRKRRKKKGKRLRKLRDAVRKARGK